VDTSLLSKIEGASGEVMSMHGQTDVNDSMGNFRRGGVVILDGGMGHELRRRGVEISGQRGAQERFLGVALANIERPVVVRDAHTAYLKAGAQVIITNNYAVVPATLALTGGRYTDMHLEHLVSEAAKRAKEAVYAFPGSPARVAGSLPPLNESYRHDRVESDLNALIKSYERICVALAPHVDILLCETMSTAEEAYAAAAAAVKVAPEKDLWISWTIADDGTGVLRNGKTLEAAVDLLEEKGLLDKVKVLSTNCAEASSIAVATARLRARAPQSIAIGAYPNGFRTNLNDEGSEYDESLTPEKFVEFVQSELVPKGATIIGGCCGIFPEHIGPIARELRHRWKVAFVETDREDSSKFCISLNIEGETSSLVSVVRSKEEQVGSMLTRLQKNLVKKAQKRKYKKHKVDESTEAAEDIEMPSILRDDGVALDSSLALHEVLTGEGQTLRVPGLGDFLIKFEYPRISNVDIRGGATANCPIVPVVETLFGEDLEFEHEWMHIGGEAVISRDRIYFPEQQDVGKQLRYTCRLKQEFQVPFSEDASEFVQSCPPRASVLERQKKFLQKEKDACRIVTYNVLADAFRHTWGRMYSYLDERYWRLEYRTPLLAREILDFGDVDVVALQEVDTKMAPYWKSLFLETHHFLFTAKARTGLEGCALLVSKARFEVVSEEDFIMNDLVNDMRKEKTWLNEFLRELPEIDFALGQVGSVLQVMTLKDRLNDHFLILTNTHAFFHPGAGNIRAIHAKVLVDLLQEKLDRLGHGKAKTILCGDLNAQASDLSLILLRKGELDPAHPEWATSSIFRWGRKANLSGYDEEEVVVREGDHDRVLSLEELKQLVDEVTEIHSVSRKLDVIAELKRASVEETDPERRVELSALFGIMEARIEVDKHKLVLRQRDLAMKDPGTGDRKVGVGLQIHHNLKLRSACGVPSFTNYVRGFHGDLDWILFQEDKAQVLQFAPFPSEKVVTEHVALPSPIFPSDHISLCADLRFLES